MTSNKIRPAMVAGMFYPQKKITLEREVALVLENAPDDMIDGKIIALVAPHAGYMYSGGVAARAYRQIIDQEFDTIVVISPSHREYFKDVSIYDGYGYSTPLGVIPIDKEMANNLIDFNPKIILSEKGHRFDEHALEVQLPFLQKVLDEFKLIPIVMGEQDLENVEILANALATVLKDKKAFIVASSDLSHFYSYDKATIMDKVVTDNVKNFNEDKLFKDVQAGRCEMCGSGPVVTAMKASKLLGADKSKVLLYRNSGDVTGDRNEVVGYMSAVFYK
jgi:AmmeMemoRadiSam system protein B